MALTRIQQPLKVFVVDELPPKEYMESVIYGYIEDNKNNAEITSKLDKDEDGTITRDTWVNYMWENKIMTRPCSFYVLSFYKTKGNPFPNWTILQNTLYVADEKGRIEPITPEVLTVPEVEVVSENGDKYNSYFIIKGSEKNKKYNIWEIHLGDYGSKTITRTNKDIDVKVKNSSGSADDKIIVRGITKYGAVSPPFIFEAYEAINITELPNN